MDPLSQKKDILKKVVNKKRTNYGYPELDRTEKNLQSDFQIKTLRGTRPVIDPDAEEKGFGPKRMKDPNFLKQLRNLQEKYKVTKYA